MPQRPEVVALTAAHQRAQNRVAGQTVRLMNAVWPMLDVQRVDSTTDRWLRLARPIVQRQHRESATLAADYYRRIRRVDLDDDIVPVLTAVPADAVEASLVMTGPAKLSQPPANQMWATTVARARSGAARSAIRMALSGGRELIVNTVQADRAALGWARVLTSADPCPFCRMMASRGPVYRSDQSASFQAHDGCLCSAQPAFAGTDLWTADAIEQRELYDQAIDEARAAGDLYRGTKNNSLNAFRRHLAKQAQ